MTELKVPSHEISFSAGQREFIHEHVEEVFKSGNVVLGRYTEEFEAAYAERCGRRFGVAMSSDTAAFEAILRIVDITGDLVLYPALGFPSLMQSVMNAGGGAWFLDADLDHGLFATAEMVEAELDRAFEHGTVAAMILMHTGGLLASEAAEIVALCHRRGVSVFEDAAHAFGATNWGVQAGSYGVASAFSLYATKPMHTMEGGIIVTDDRHLAERARVMRNYGRVANFGRSIVTEHGNSWRMTEIQAIVGLANLQEIEENIEDRRAIMEDYDMLIDRHPTFRDVAARLAIPDGMQPNGYRYICLLSQEADAATRLQLKHGLRERFGIDLPGEVYELPTHKQPIWQERYWAVEMPVAEDFCERHFALPCYPTLVEKIGLDEIVDAVAETLKQIGAPTWTS